MTGKTINFFGWHADALTLICLLLFMGAMGKSAQFPLHVWLPDAMEGPTPVSALIHAATMVAAGVFMVARLSPLFELAPDAQAIVMRRRDHGVLRRDHRPRAERHQAGHGLFDLSQLGYMMLAIGAGAYSVGMFHLFTHAFFKALLFLGSGSVIYAMHHEQDIRKMGGLKKKIPFTLRYGDRHARADRLPADRRLLLQGRDHRTLPTTSNNPFALYAFLMTIVAAAA